MKLSPIKPIKPINYVANKQQSGAGKHNDKRKRKEADHARDEILKSQQSKWQA